MGPQLSKGRRGEEASAQWGGGGRDGSPVSQIATNQVTWEPDRIMGKGGHKYRKGGNQNTSRGAFKTSSPNPLQRAVV